MEFFLRQVSAGLALHNTEDPLSASNHNEQAAQSPTGGSQQHLAGMNVSQLLLSELLKILLAFGNWAKCTTDGFRELISSGQPWGSQSRHHCTSLCPRSGAVRKLIQMHERVRELVLCSEEEPDGTESTSVCQPP